MHIRDWADHRLISGLDFVRGERRLKRSLLLHLAVE
jgi:hypothetical protein